MAEKLLNIEEVCRNLGISEEDLRNLVDRGEIPAYRLGGTILRFKKDQIDIIKARGIPDISELDKRALSPARDSWLEKFKDFVYFNDFYIVSVIIIVILLIAIFFY
jgi:excisionase family DNA binding protein